MLTHNSLNVNAKYIINIMASGKKAKAIVNMLDKTIES